MATKSKKALLGQIDKLIKTSVIAYLALAVLAIVLMAPSSINLVWQYATADPVASEASSQLGAAESTIIDVEYRYALAAALGFSVLLLIILATRFKKQHDKSIKSRQSWYKWAYIGLSWTAFLSVAALTFGVNSTLVLNSAGLFLVLAMALWWLAERESVLAKKPKWFAFWAGLVAVLAAVAPILCVALTTWAYGNINFSWYAYTVGVILLAGSAGLAYNGVKSLKQIGAWKNYEFAERNYFAIDLATKTLVTIVLIVGLLK